MLKVTLGRNTTVTLEVQVSSCADGHKPVQSGVHFGLAGECAFNWDCHSI